VRNIFHSLQLLEITMIKPHPRESSSVFVICATDCLLQGARDNMVRLFYPGRELLFLVGKKRGWFSVGNQPKLGRGTLFRGPRI
jgi:hypothetical protein